MNQKKMILLECLFLTMAPVETLQWQLGSQDMPMIIQLPHEVKCICLSLVLSFIMPSCLTLWNWRFYYFANPHGTTIELLGTRFTRIFLVLMLILHSHEIAHCAGELNLYLTLGGPHSEAPSAAFSGPQREEILTNHR